MRVLWQDSPSSARQVLNAVEGETGWAYSTVKTILARLHEKGVLAVETRGNTSYYAPLLEQGTARRSAVKKLLERAFDGTFGSLLHHMVDEESLSRKERTALRKMLREAGIEAEDGAEGEA
jgi:BlaI family penicillinase repressor